jgi:hypothetical protein
LVAASFSAEALNLRQIIPGSVQPGRVVSHKELEFLEKLSPRSNAPELSEDEFMKKYGPVPGVRIGWLGLQCASYPDSVIFEDKSATLLPGDLWRLVLQPAFVAGLGAASLDRLPIHLSLWRTEVFPLSGALHSYVREGAQINGRVIGWFSGQQTLHPKLADLQESK